MYSKPEVIVLDSAVKAIQGNDKPPLTFRDNVTGVKDATIHAYQADE